MLPAEPSLDQLETLYGGHESQVVEEIDETETRTETPTPMGPFITVTIQRKRTVYR